MCKNHRNDSARGTERERLLRGCMPSAPSARDSGELHAHPGLTRLWHRQMMSFCHGYSWTVARTYVGTKDLRPLIVWVDERIVTSVCRCRTHASFASDPDAYQEFCVEIYNVLNRVCDEYLCLWRSSQEAEEVPIVPCMLVFLWYKFRSCCWWQDPLHQAWWLGLRSFAAPMVPPRPRALRPDHAFCCCCL
jgi:hypothetical protein